MTQDFAIAGCLQLLAVKVVSSITRFQILWNVCNDQKHFETFRICKWKKSSQVRSSCSNTHCFGSARIEIFLLGFLDLRTWRRKKKLSLCACIKTHFFFFGSAFAVCTSRAQVYRWHEISEFAFWKRSSQEDVATTRLHLIKISLLAHVTITIVATNTTRSSLRLH